MKEVLDWKTINEALPESGKDYFCFVDVLIKRKDRIESAVFNTRTRNFQVEYVIVKGVELWCHTPIGAETVQSKNINNANLGGEDEEV